MKGGDLHKLLRTAKVCIMALRKGVTSECPLMNWNGSTMTVQLPHCKIVNVSYIKITITSFHGECFMLITSFRYMPTSLCAEGGLKKDCNWFLFENLIIFLTGIYWPGLSVWRTRAPRSYLTSMCFYQSKGMIFLTGLPVCITVSSVCL